ncbi:MAG: alpha/beta fold hydrolase [Bacteroidota bacterium]|nr:alpha/beta fold hydrolase [Bacteroidota bacterium]
MTVLLAIIITLVVFLLIVTLILLIIGPTILLQPRRRYPDFYQKINHPVTPKDLGLQYEEIEVITSDGIKLNSWLIKSDSRPKGTIIFLHGVGDCKIAGLPFVKFFWENGFNIFLYDSRRHGLSGGTFCTYGYYEKFDLISVLEYVESRKDIKLGNIGVFGTSMGAAIAIQAARIDKRIKAVVSENSFATLRSIFDDYQKRIIKIPFHYLRNIVIKRSEIMARFKARDVSPLQLVAGIHIPILFVYSPKDKHINYTNSIKLYENTDDPKELFPIENAKHNDAWEVGGKVYHEKLLDFFNKNLT